jgi:hypothetical protein
MWDSCDSVVSRVVNDVESGERSIVLFVILISLFLTFYHATCSVLTTLVISSEVLLSCVPSPNLSHVS